ncbi:MAG: transglutaminase-like domain-containing protein [Tractidigestivibacter sp.]|jgi:transglutaminase-like putative cysteine protease|uniref:transglutaminase-like domain-containing protein n=1 Tax=Tractidigestivibacter sp. TaxID=2847320 RepID=UPI003D94F6BE
MPSTTSTACDLNADFLHLRDGLPPEIERAKQAGDLKRALRLIDAALADDARAELAPLLRAERCRIMRTPQEYCITRDQALAAMRKEIASFSTDELDALVNRGRIDWRMVDGEMRFLPSWMDSLRFYPAEVPGIHSPESRNLAARDALLAEMRENGVAARRITLRAHIRPLVDVERNGVVRAWLPVPASCPQQSRIEILDATPGVRVAPEDAPQRTAHWESRGAGRRGFEVTYRYDIRAQYVSPDQIACSGEQPTFDLGEEEPHIVFTPYLRRLTERVTSGCSTPLERARAIYDWICENVDYRFQPPYLLLDSLADSAAKSLRADCGVFATLFITMCRIAGIPARWQSGLSVRPDGVGCHDWAMFYIAPHGWLWADCSFGSAARREGDEDRREFYFGNLDPWRMVANCQLFAQLDPPDLALREDPFDNQLGEMSVDGVGLTRHQMERTVGLVSMERLEPVARGH